MSEQYINKGEMIRWLDTEIRKTKGDQRKTLSEVIQKVITMPEQDVRANIHAHWQRAEIRSMLDGKGISVWHCSNCRTVGQPYKRFCGSCGAVMEWRNDETE